MKINFIIFLRSKTIMDYSIQTKSQLKEICSKLGIKGFSKKNKTQLIQMIQEKESSKDFEPKSDLKVKQLKKVASDMSTSIEKICEHIASVDNVDIRILRSKEVIQWIFGDLSFLPDITKKNKKHDSDQYKILEDIWGQNTLKIIRPDLKLDKQWTNLFGEYICKEIHILLNKIVKKPVKKENKQPDWEIDDAILEVKTQTFFTSGTAGEKILGCPFKYAEIPELYDKPLKIICIGGAEKCSRESYGNLAGAKCTRRKQKFLDFFRDNQIEYIGATDILKCIIIHQH
jgi:hypothetical protein